MVPLGPPRRTRDKLSPKTAEFATPLHSPSPTIRATPKGSAGGVRVIPAGSLESNVVLQPGDFPGFYVFADLAAERLDTVVRAVFLKLA